MANKIKAEKYKIQQCKHIKATTIKYGLQNHEHKRIQKDNKIQL